MLLFVFVCLFVVVVFFLFCFFCYLLLFFFFCCFFLFLFFLLLHFEELHERLLTLRGWLYSVEFTPFCPKTSTSVTSCLLSSTQSSFWKGVDSKRKDVAPLVHSLSFLEQNPFKNVAKKKHFDSIFSLGSVSVLLNA